LPYAENQGTRIYWEEHGSGEPLLMIMGLGASLDWWYRSVPVLSLRYRAILLDNRGVGRSQQPPGPYTIPQMAADAAAVLDAAGESRAHVFGCSMGGIIAQEFALQYPDRVHGLILGCTACGGPHAIRADAQAAKVLTDRPKMSMEEALAASAPILYDAGTPRARIDEDFVVRRRTFPAPEAYVAQLQAIYAWQSYDRLPQITVPTLVIHGESDRLVPSANAVLIAGRIPGAKLVLLPHAGHLFTTDRTEAAHAAVLDFLQSVSPLESAADHSR
jgi:pimeloyl-ACP methyl ester carboxylesterase